MEELEKRINSNSRSSRQNPPVDGAFKKPKRKKQTAGSNSKRTSSDWTCMRKLRRVNLTEAVTKELLEMINSRAMKAGDKLPSEYELTTVLSVSRTPVREALRILNSIGILKTKQGEGTFVADLPLDSYMKPLRFMIKLDRKGIKDLMQLRRILEKEIVKMAAGCANVADIENLEKMLKAQEETFKRGNNQKGIDASFEFHRAIAAASGNEVLARVLDITRDLLIVLREKVSERTNINFISVKHHQAIFKAISDGQPETAAKLTMEHLNYLEELYLTTLSDENCK